MFGNSNAFLDMDPFSGLRSQQCSRTRWDAWLSTELFLYQRGMRVSDR